jgi:hypothetical protein
MNFEGRAMTTASIRTALFATAAVVLIWRGAATESDDVRYGLQAAFETSRVELTLALPLFCVRVIAHLADPVMALSASSGCLRCGSTEARRWRS